MDYQEIIQKWRGDDNVDIPEPDPKYEHDLQGQLSNRLGSFCANKMIRLFQPAPSEEKGASMIAIWENSEKRGRDIRLRTRPGKAFKRMLPWLNQVELAELGDWYRELMLLNNSEVVIKSSTEAEHFKLAYAGEQAPMANPRTTCDRKVLSYSCMRSQFEHLPVHPAEIYASGVSVVRDFWTEGGLI